MWLHILATIEENSLVEKKIQNIATSALNSGFHFSLSSIMTEKRA
jgi:hypothetical protein